MIADKNDKEEIKALFDLCFPEEPGFNSYFFDTRYNYKNTLVYKINGEIVSSLQMLPYNHTYLGDVTYIYGACTAPKYRGRSIMSNLLEFSFQKDMKNNVKASVLIPANKSLFGFYDRFGYKTGFYCSENIECLKNYHIGEKDIDLTIKKAEESSVGEIKRIYNTSLKKVGYIERSGQYILSQLKMFYKFGGNVFMLCRGNTFAGYAFVCSGDIPFVQEIITEKAEDIDIFKALLLRKLNTEKAKFISPFGDKAMGCVKIYGDKEKDNFGYMNLMFN